MPAVVQFEYSQSLDFMMRCCKSIRLPTAIDHANDERQNRNRYL